MPSRSSSRRRSGEVIDLTASPPPAKRARPSWNANEVVDLVSSSSASSSSAAASSSSSSSSRRTPASVLLLGMREVNDAVFRSLNAARKQSQAVRDSARARAVRAAVPAGALVATMADGSRATEERENRTTHFAINWSSGPRSAKAFAQQFRALGVGGTDGPPAVQTVFLDYLRFPSAYFVQTWTPVFQRTGLLRQLVEKGILARDVHIYAANVPHLWAQIRARIPDFDAHFAMQPIPAEDNLLWRVTDSMADHWSMTDDNNRINNRFWLDPGVVGTVPATHPFLRITLRRLP